MSTLKERDSKVIWHPYTQMKIWPEAIGIVSGKGACVTDEDGREYIDAVSSWWVNLHGHSHPHIAQMISEQLLTLEHVIFAGFTHEPAVQLAERLLPLLPGDMSKVFYSDNGSTAVEVAIKMAIQYWQNKKEKRTKIIALDQAYHGDTFGAMSISGRSIFTDAFADKLFDVATVPFPEKGKEDISLRELERLLSSNDIAALIIEPLVLGASGMLMYDATVLEQFFSLCKKYNTLIIADEVMVGFGRTDTLFACHQVSTKPDMICLSKGLTGGTMPLGVTACTQDIFDAFYDDDRTKTLYHGHSFTGNPIACTAGLASLDLLLKDECLASRKAIINAHTSFREKIQHLQNIKEIRQTGTILTIELQTGEGTSYNSKERDFIYRFFLDKGILMRPLGNIIYILPPYCITQEQLYSVYTAIEELLSILSIAA